MSLEAYPIGPFLLRSHLFFLLVGIALAIELFFRLALTQGLPLHHFQRRAHWYLLAFLAGGRFFAVLVLYRVYLQDPPRFFILWDGSFSFLGGCVGVASLLFFDTLQQRATFLQWLDALVPSAALGLAFDWLGRFFGAISYGKPTDVPWGVTVESMAVRYTVPIHPVQLYYAVFFLTLTLVLLLLRKRARRAGVLTLVGILLGTAGVLSLEVFRGDFAVTVFAKLTDFVFLGVLFTSLGTLAVFERRFSHRYSLGNSILLTALTVAYLFFRPWIAAASVEWRFSQFLAVLACLGAVVYVVVHRWKYPHL